MRKVLLSVAIGALPVCAILAGTGTASALEPVSQPDQGRIGVNLTHDETVALADGPIPALLSMVVSPSHLGAGLQPDTQLDRDPNGGVHASMRQVIMEPAAHPDGTVTIYLDAPGSHGPRILDIYEHWQH
ncbi:hypothetical protein [Nocardia stercoris]|uniref:Uncharacterized protein n=1 Tax=Nocardia stercoris TaxID=2483361 RepID=A0A3M2L4R0_9NOCA|nr:hypothetical protein [Nocardia stercoris]RMI30865.1 hypothetical protein EBN03_19660 [Nocardia stercoris]